MFSKLQIPLCMAMDKTKNTNEENSKSQADIKATCNSVNKLNARARKAVLNIQQRLKQLEEEQEHFRNENKNQQNENLCADIKSMQDNFDKDINLVKDDMNHKNACSRTDISWINASNRDCDAAMLQLSQDFYAAFIAFELMENNLQ